MNDNRFIGQNKLIEEISHRVLWCARFYLKDKQKQYFSL